MIEHIDKLAQAGVYSFKVEGRMKSVYYVASVINAYRKAFEIYKNNPNDYKPSQMLIDELYKNSHRDYTTGFFFGEKDSVCLESAQPKCDYEFSAEVIDYNKEKKMLLVEMRNRFKKGDVLEILSNNDKYWNKQIQIDEIYDEKGNLIDDVKLVQQRVYIPTEYELTARDILRKRL